MFVRAGATLNIAAGTRVIGESGSVGTLIVDRGGRLNAIGTAAAPIVFTSDQPIGQRGRGDWGGIIINGRAPVNFGSGEAAGEGDTGVYGGNDPNDNSGTLQYVRVEFSGVEFSPDNELNGIAFQAVGRGTVVHHVQAHMSRDDALEWFGGTVDGKYLVMSNAADDALDWTFGWNGRVQFAAITQRGDDADNGIEADNNDLPVLAAAMPMRSASFLGQRIHEQNALQRLAGHNEALDAHRSCDATAPPCKRSCQATAARGSCCRHRANDRPYIGRCLCAGSSKWAARGS